MKTRERWVDGWMDVCLRAYLLAAQIAGFPDLLERSASVSSVYSTVSAVTEGNEIDC